MKYMVTTWSLSFFEDIRLEMVEIKEPKTLINNQINNRYPKKVIF